MMKKMKMKNAENVRKTKMKKMKTKMKMKNAENVRKTKMKKMKTKMKKVRKTKTMRKTKKMRRTKMMKKVRNATTFSQTRVIVIVFLLNNQYSHTTDIQLVEERL
ncbi:uncharacterized protein LOC124288024 isoform X24 [Haliotis rubra]|uniref:uncharacterized protein LOC124288024 isoform X24 n=1 Tax=Haliotis rubra TaxID=36100 RepID=UPI001EE53C74|nr:uncharacterized protein LOC124288024 isoform X24 [Haliotis rubra]